MLVSGQWRTRESCGDKLADMSGRRHRLSGQFYDEVSRALCPRAVCSGSAHLSGNWCITCNCKT